MSDEICFMSALELAAEYQANSLSPVECTRAMLERIERINPRLNAYFYVDHDGALKSARESEQRWQRKAPLGPMDGIPVSFKDHILVAGMPSPWGLNVGDPKTPSPEDAPITASLRDGGAVLLGKTTQPEMAAFCSVVSGLYGIGRNPWNLNLSPGGSSGGAAAALAAGLCTIAIGSDGGGSIRVPAAYCSVFGHKPSFGRVPIYPPMGPGPVYGPMSRTVAETAAALNVVTRPDWRDIYSLPYEARDYLQGIDGGVCGLRIAACLSFGYGNAPDAETARLFQQAIQNFRSLGAEVTEVPPPFDFNLYNALFPGFAPGLAMMMRALAGNQLDRLLPELQEILRRLDGMTTAQLMQGKMLEIQSCFKIAAVFKDFDLILTPATPEPAFPADRVFPEGFKLNEWGYCFDHNPYTWPYNMTQQPAASVPCGFTAAGLPMGIQIAGKRFDDFGVLKAAYAYERVFSRKRPWPELR